MKWVRYIVPASFLMLGVSLFSLMEPSLKNHIGGIFTSFSANFSYSSGEGLVYTGKIYYEYPGKLHLKLSDGRIIATNGTYLWLFNPETMKCARQKVTMDNGNFLGMLSAENLVSSTDTNFVFEKPGGKIREVIINTQGNMIKNARLKINENYVSVSFSNVETDIGIKASLFNYKPPTDAQLVENPLNQIATQ